MPTVRDLVGHDPIPEASLDLIAAMLHSVHHCIEHANCDQDEFARSSLVQDAVMYRLLCAGEAAKKLEGQYRLEANWRYDHPDETNRPAYNVQIAKDDWTGIITMREILAHASQCNQDTSIVWRVVTEDLPRLLPPLIQSLGSASFKWFTGDGRPQRATAYLLVAEPLVANLQETMSGLWKLHTVQEQLRTLNNTLIERTNVVVEEMNRSLAVGAKSLGRAAENQLAEMNAAVATFAKRQMLQPRESESD